MSEKTRAPNFRVIQRCVQTVQALGRDISRQHRILNRTNERHRRTYLQTKALLDRDDLLTDVRWWRAVLAIGPKRRIRLTIGLALSDGFAYKRVGCISAPDMGLLVQSTEPVERLQLILSAFFKAEPRSGCVPATVVIATWLLVGHLALSPDTGCFQLTAPGCDDEPLFEHESLEVVLRFIFDFLAS